MSQAWHPQVNGGAWGNTSSKFCCRMLRKSGWLSMSQSPDSSRLRFRSARRSARLPKITVLSCSDDMFGNLRQNSGLNDCGDASQGQDDKQQQCPCTHTTTKPSSAHAHANTTLRGSMHFFQSKATQLQPQKHCALWLAAGLSQSLLRGEHSDWF